MSLNAVPAGVDLTAVQAALLVLPDVTQDDLHVWPLSTTDTALTVPSRADRKS